MSEYTAADRVCSMIWNSIYGWQNRPDYFDTNDLVLLGDLAYRANIDKDVIGPILEVLNPSDIQDVCIGLMTIGEYDNLWEYLVSVNAGPIPLMCDLSKYGKWRK